MNPTVDALLTLARRAACRAGEHVLSQIGRRADTDQVSRHDIKHKLDREAQERAESVIREAFPNHAILGEETSDAPLPDAGVRWVIDPIDGTINFTHGLPIWCCSVAAQIDERTVAAAVFAPELRLLFEARADGPALCNGESLRVSDTEALDRALVHTGADKSELNGRPFRFLTRIAEVVQRPRVTGSAALDICWVAAGRADAYFESGVFLWDVAAAGLILERAGGRCEQVRNHPGYRMAVLATNGRLHPQLRDVVMPLL